MANTDAVNALKQYLEVAAPLNVQGMEILDRSELPVSCYEFCHHHDTKGMAPTVSRSSHGDHSIPHVRVMQTLADLIRLHDGLRHEFMYGSKDWKGGLYIASFQPDVMVKPNDTLDPYAKEAPVGWLIPYDTQHQFYPCDIIGKLFVQKLEFLGIAKDGRAIINKATYYLEVFEGQHVALADDTVLTAGYYELGYGDLLGGIKYHQPIDKAAYLAAKDVSASLLSEEPTGVELTEMQCAEKYLEIVAQDDAKELEVIEGECFTHPLIHVSPDPEIKAFVPFVSARTIEGLDKEDRSLPRVCVTTNVQHSLWAAGFTRSVYGYRHNDQKWPVVTIYGLRAPLVFRPSKRLVNDAPETGELWLLRYSMTTQQYVPETLGELFLRTIVMSPRSTNDRPEIEKIVWFVKCDKPFIWVDGATFQPGYYHVTEICDLDTDRRNTKIRWHHLSEEEYVDAKKALLEPREHSVNPGSAEW